MSGQSSLLSFPTGRRKRQTRNRVSCDSPGSPLSQGRRLFTRALSIGVGDLLRGLIGAYQLLIAPLLLPSCRFEPSCSHYAQEAIAVHGTLRGVLLTLKRLARCHPWGGSGHDPVPPHLDH